MSFPIFLFQQKLIYFHDPLPLVFPNEKLGGGRQIIALSGLVHSNFNKLSSICDPEFPRNLTVHLWSQAVNQKSRRLLYLFPKHFFNAKNRVNTIWKSYFSFVILKRTQSSIFIFPGPKIITLIMGLQSKCEMFSLL